MFLSFNKCCLWSSRSGRYGSRALWDPKDHSPPHSVSRSLSGSPSPSPPHSRHRVGPHPRRPHGRPYSPHHHPRYQPYAGRPHKRVGTCTKWGNVELTRWMPLMLMTSVNCCLMSVTNVHIRHTDFTFFKWLDLIGCPEIDQTELFSLWIFLHTISWCSCPCLCDWCHYYREVLSQWHEASTWWIKQVLLWHQPTSILLQGGSQLQTWTTTVPPQDCQDHDEAWNQDKQNSKCQGRWHSGWFSL